MQQPVSLESPVASMRLIKWFVWIAWIVLVWLLAVDVYASHASGVFQLSLAGAAATAALVLFTALPTGQRKHSRIPAIWALGALALIAEAVYFHEILDLLLQLAGLE